MSRAVAFEVLRQITGEGAYANLALSKRLAKAKLSARDAALVTELVAGTCRAMGTYDRIIEAAAGRPLTSMQPAVVDVLRLGTHQLLAMRSPAHAAVGATVELAKQRIGRRVTGIVNAVLRKVAARSLEEWLDVIADGLDEMGALALRNHHPRWVAESIADVLPHAEVADALAANNVAPTPTLVVRPGLASVEELGGTATSLSPFGAVREGAPSAVAAVREGRAGVQDEGSQLVAWALARSAGPEGPWLDLCAGPGGKAALLAGLARERGTMLLASELQEHRAQLVRNALAVYGEAHVVAADGTRPAWPQAAFAKVMADVPCSGLGALRRRPESRWRRHPEDVTELVPLQRALLDVALSSALPGGVVAYVTCSPHRAETREVVEQVVGARDDVEVLDARSALPEVPDAGLGPYVQLWPHRHGTDAMFLALLRRRPEVRR